MILLPKGLPGHMTSRSTTPIPIPGVELQRMRSYLAPQYGSEVWDQEGVRVLVVRTPGEEPDVVNDLESAVEYLSPGDVQVEHCLLVGEKRVTAVSVTPLRELMEQRLRLDHQVATHLRTQIPGDRGHIVYRSPQDPLKMTRLGVRIQKSHAREVDDADLDAAADAIGPMLESGQYKNIRAVYILGAQDEVRIDGHVFMQDIRTRWEDDSRRINVEAKQRAEEAEARQRRAAERSAILHDLDRRFTAHAPRTTRPHVGDEVDRIVGRRITHTPKVGSTTAVTRNSTRSSELPSGGGRPVSLDPITDLDRRLRAVGYETLPRPNLPGHRVDLAAERTDGEAQRLIVRSVPHIDMATARSWLATAKTLGVDLAILVAPTADDDAQTAFIATNVQWVRPDAFDRLML